MQTPCVCERGTGDGFLETTWGERCQHGATFALIRIGEGTIGLLSQEVPEAAPASAWTAEQCSALHLEFSTDNLDALYEELRARGVHFHEPPHDEPGSVRWRRMIPTAIRSSLLKAAAAAISPTNSIEEFLLCRNRMSRSMQANNMAHS